MLLNLTYYSSEPIHNQIVNQVLMRIFEEDKLPGDELDSIRKISRQHHIEKASIKKAFNKLEQLGVVSSTDNDKYYVNDISTRALKLLIDRDYNNSKNISEYDLLANELNAAKHIQNGLLPKSLPSNDFIDVAAYSTISDDVGGDFYDFFELEKNKFGIIIGDASGKGFPAAMLISQIQAIIKSDYSQKRSNIQTIHLVNSYMNTYLSAKYFATLFYGILDLEIGELKYINAGHNFPILIDENITIKRLNTTGPALGLMGNANYEEVVIGISNNDLLFLFTDGLSERMNDTNELFGEDRIIRTISGSLKSGSDQIVKEIEEAASLYSSKSEEADDTTFMAVKIRISNSESRISNWELKRTIKDDIKFNWSFWWVASESDL